MRQAADLEALKNSLPPLQSLDKPDLFLKDVRVAAAVYLHGLAGDMARDMLHENTVLATDLLENLSESFRDCELQMDRQLFCLQK